LFDQEELNEVYDDVFKPHRMNPNGCPIMATFYVSHNWTNYDIVKRLYERGHEIASHSITHRMPQSFWTKASYGQWKEELVGQRENIANKASIPIEEIQGVRAPFLETGGDEQVKVHLLGVGCRPMQRATV